MKIKKKLIVVLICLMLLTETAAFAWDPIATVLGVYTIADAIVKGYKKFECDWKGKCETKIYPKPGYTDGNCKTYNEDDLIAHYRDYRDSYGFDATNPPTNAVASLGDRKLGDGIGLASIDKSLKPSESRKTYTFANDLSKYWGKFNKGSIIFNAGTNKANLILEYISDWTHVGMKYDNDKYGNPRIFDSIPDSGVQIRNIYDSFRSGYAYSVKEIKTLGQDKINNALESAKKYIGMPYAPRNFIGTYERDDYTRKYADKNDTSNINCAKLVYLTFKPYGADLDSNRMICNIYANFSKEYSDDLGKWVEYAWIGVAPDDIYYSKNMGKDMFCIGRLASKTADLKNITP